jgi:hypothetical protein
MAPEAAAARPWYADRRIMVPAGIAFAFGFAMWMIASIASGRKEPWDAPFYWSMLYPGAIALCAVLGWFWPRRSWLWALVLFEAQIVAATVRSGEVGNLWPLAMMLFAFMALPGMGIGWLAAWLRHRLRFRA